MDQLNFLVGLDFGVALAEPSQGEKSRYFAHVPRTRQAFMDITSQTVLSHREHQEVPRAILLNELSTF